MPDRVLIAHYVLDSRSEMRKEPYGTVPDKLQNNDCNKDYRVARTNAGILMAAALRDTAAKQAHPSQPAPGTLEATSVSEAQHAQHADGSNDTPCSND